MEECRQVEQLGSVQYVRTDEIQRPIFGRLDESGAIMERSKEDRQITSAPTPRVLQIKVKIPFPAAELSVGA